MTILGSQSTVFFVYLLVFVGALLAFEGLRQFLTRGETDSESRNRRMRMMKAGASPEDVLSVLAENTRSAKNRRSLLANLRRFLLQAGVAADPILALFSIGVISAGIFVGLPLLLPVPSLVAAAASIVVGAGIPYTVVALLRSERRRKLVAQLPDALDMMARGLKVGHPLAVTVESVSRDMPDPIGSEFGIVHDQVSYGDDLVTAFREFADRTELEDTRYLAVSVGIQHGTGGNLGRVLHILSKVIRDRATMRKRIKAISSEGRLSALILTVLPAAIFLSIHVATPSFYGDVMSDPLFAPFIATIVGLIVFQGLILHRLVNFRI